MVCVWGGEIKIQDRWHTCLRDAVICASEGGFSADSEGLTTRSSGQNYGSTVYQRVYMSNSTAY